MSADSALQSLSLRGTRHVRVFTLLASALLVVVCVAARGQSSFGPNPASSDPSFDSLPDVPLPQLADTAQASDEDAVSLRNTPIRVFKDQAAIWTSPARIRDSDMYVLVPLVVATTVVVTTDHQVMTSVDSHSASFMNLNVKASNGLLGGFVAAPAVLFGMGRLHKDDHASETGILAGEAMADSLVVDEVMKAVSMRERPALDNAKGKFFQTSVGLNSSFPSTHSIIAWSSATVIASEYSGPMTQLTAYGLAAGVSLTRVLGQQHFPSDVIVGSAVGWMIGRYVYRKHRKFETE